MERHEALDRAVKELKLTDEYYDSILLDEVQDYWSCEVELLGKLTKRLFVVGDRNQRVYDRNEGLDAAIRIGCKEYRLKFHYRMGRKICAVGDRLRAAGTGKSLEKYCQYDEKANPSKVDVHPTASREEELAVLKPILERQLRAYPEEWIGVITATKNARDQAAAFLSTSTLGGQVAVQAENVKNRTFDSKSRIVVSTLHSAKGAEFRAVHFMAADEFPRYTREKAFTVVTRAKTALDVYHGGPMTGSLESALAQREVPDLEDLF
jgi:superfamily I DNA and RNA helicase